LRELRAGKSLTKPQIGRDFGCSQATVCATLMRLQEEGLVKKRGYHGTTVTRNLLAEGVLMAEIRIKFEMEGVRHATEALSDDDFSRIRTAYRKWMVPPKRRRWRYATISL
jgi:DNA-binding GntR family transcriptional regulator